MSGGRGEGVGDGGKVDKDAGWRFSRWTLLPGALPGQPPSLEPSLFSLGGRKESKPTRALEGRGKKKPNGRGWGPG